MKKLPLFALIGILLSFTSCNYGTAAPKKVNDAFVKKFPTATMVKWDKESDNEWEAEFKKDGVDYSANFMVDGSWKNTEHKVEEAEIPIAVLQSLKSNFEGYDVNKMEILETAEHKVYEFGIQKDDNEMEVVIDTTGTVLKKEMKDKNGDNEASDTD